MILSGAETILVPLCFFTIMDEQIISFTFFRFKGWSNRWWGFRQMGLVPPLLPSIEGLSFAKMLGSGAGNGFSIRPNFGVYGLLGVWKDEATARTFFKEDPLLEEFKERAASIWTVFLRTAQSHGQWDGVAPFKHTVDFDRNSLVAVLTRATIAPKKLWQFWRFVPSVSRSMSKAKEGLIFAVGIGELPLIQQATFSLWENSELMTKFAYQSHHHKRVVKKTRELDWYKEELFARFHPFDSMGSWEGKDPLDAFLSKTSQAQTAIHGAKP